MGRSVTGARLVPVEEAAPRMGRHPQTLRRDLRDGRVPGIKVAGRWFMSSSVLDGITSGAGDPLYRLGWLESALERLAQSDAAAAAAWEDYRRLGRGDG